MQNSVIVYNFSFWCSIWIPSRSLGHKRVCGVYHRSRMQARTASLSVGWLPSSLLFLGFIYVWKHDPFVLSLADYTQHRVWHVLHPHVCFTWILEASWIQSWLVGLAGFCMCVVYVRAEAKKVFSSVTLHIVIIVINNSIVIVVIIIIIKTGSPPESEAHCCLGWPPSSQDPPLSASCTEVTGMYGHAWLLHGCWGFEPRSSCFYSKLSNPWSHLPKPLRFAFHGPDSFIKWCFVLFVFHSANVAISQLACLQTLP